MASAKVHTARQHLRADRVLIALRRQNQRLLRHQVHYSSSKLRRMRWLVLLAPLLAALACGHDSVGNSARATQPVLEQTETSTVREQHIARFLARRQALSPLCLYTFDRPVARPPPPASDAAAAPPPAFFANHVPACPFGDLEFDPTVVTPLHDADHAWQLGARIANDAHEQKRVQIASTGFVFARDFYAATVGAREPNESSDQRPSGAGVTFEMALRRLPSTAPRTQNSNDSTGMTLFSIVNVYDGCVDPGFRVDVDRDRMLVLVYYLPVEDEIGEPACYEQLLRSAREHALFERQRTKCQLPEPTADEGANPPVSITVTIDPSSSKGVWRSEFRVSYADPVTLEGVQCSAFGQKSPPLGARLISQRVTGNFRLFLGNSPRNASAVRERRVPAPARTFRPLSSEDAYKNATERLRATLLDKLLSIEGPRIPEAMRIFGDKSISLELFGVEFPPVNEDTPLAYLRGKLRDFLVENGGNIVDHLIDLLRKVQPVDSEPNVSVGERIVKRTFALQRQELEQEAAGLREYPDAAFASSFDVFHFAIYARALTPKELDDSSWPTLGPFRPIPTTAQEIHINEDDVVAVDLGLLQSVYDDVQLELRALPELGQLLLYPSKAVVTRDNMTSFRDLPPAHQQMIYFQPNRDENNRNLPLPYSFAFARRSEPYAVIKVGMVGPSTGRAIDTAATASVKIFVDPVNDPPRPLHMEQCVVLPGAGVPVVLDLKGNDADGSPVPPAASSRSDNSSSGGDKTSVLKTIVDRITSTHAPAPSPRQFVRVRRLPRFGRLYDMHLATQNVSLELPIGLDRTHLEKYRVSLDDAVNGSFSPNLVYVYGGWNGSIDSDSDDTGVAIRSGDVELVDELQYQLSDSEDGVLSDLAVVKFVLRTSEKRRQRDSNVFKIVRLQEDASVAVTLADIEPLMGFLSARTRFVITDFPKHGALHQFHDLCTAAEDVHAGIFATYRVGRKLHNASRIVDDVDGRVVYVPERDYYNVVPDDNTTRSLIATGIDLDTFAFEPENLTHHVELFERWAATEAPPDSFSARAHALPFDAHRARVVQVQVVSEPDELILLPPTYFVANATQGSTVPTPVLFEDPDALYDGKYLATLKVKSGLSKFVLAGINISSDDVMRDCNLTRPCLLPRTFGTNASTSQSTTARNESVEELTFVVQHLIYTPFHVTVLGTKSALQRALSETTFTDWSVNFLEAHRERFAVTIRRLNGTSATANTRSATATYTIDFPPRLVSGLGGMVVQVVHLVVGQLYAFVWTLLVCVVVCVLISNVSCGSGGGGSCCCCCAGRTRESRRRAVEDELVCFESQVAQNDYEYSMLLMDIADMALEPDLMFATSLVRAIHSVAGRQANADMRLLCVQSLVPVLELERQTTRLVFRLMALEFQDALVANERAMPSGLASEFLGASSCASYLLAYFCRYIGSNWLDELLIGVATADGLSVPESADRHYHGQDNADTVLGSCIEQMARALPHLPAEIVILCRACATLFIDNDDRWRSDVSVDAHRAVHLVFFNHFVGPALLFRGEGVIGAGLSPTLSSSLANVACQLATLTRRWDSQPDYQRTDADRTISLVDDVELRRERRDQAHLHQYESLLHAVATSPALLSSYNASAADDAQPSSSDKMQRERDVDCDLMALCLTNLHSLLDSYLPQVEEHHRHLDTHRQQQQQLQFESEHTSASSRLSRLRTLLRALGFPITSVSAILECRAQEPREDELCGGFGHREWATFADERTRQDRQCRLATQTSPINVEQTAGTRPLGRSQSLLTVDVEDSLAFEYAFSDISDDSERF